MSEIPTGFEKMARPSAFVELVGPFYIKESEDGISIGIRIEHKHCNSAKKVHGGLIATMADIALGHGIAHASVPKDQLNAWRKQQTPLKHKFVNYVTAQLSTDFTGSARIGDWLEMIVDVQKVGRTLAYANAYLHKNSQRIARSSGIFCAVSNVKS